MPGIKPNSHFKSLARQHRNPLSVQKFLRSFPYNNELRGETCRSAAKTLQHGEAHCLEASFLAAAILEHHGYPPLVLSLESQDGLDHVLFVYQHKNLWGSVSRSRDEGLNGRLPAFRSLRQLVWSYFDPYIDEAGRITAFGLCHLDDCQMDWRNSPRNLWQAEEYLIEMPHTDLPSSDARYHKFLHRFARQGPLKKGRHWC